MSGEQQIQSYEMIYSPLSTLSAQCDVGYDCEDLINKMIDLNKKIERLKLEQNKIREAKKKETV